MLLLLILLPWSKGLWVYSIVAGGSLELELEWAAAASLTPLAGTAALVVFAVGGGNVVTFPVPLLSLSLSLSVVFLKPWLDRPNRLPKLLPHPCDCGCGGCCCCFSNSGWGCGSDGCSTRRSLPPAPISESQLVGKCPIRRVRLNH